MTYLISQMLICLLIAALFGLFFGWLLWGRIVRALRKELAGNNSRLAKLHELPSRLNELETKHSSLLAEKEVESLKFNARGNEFKHALSAKDAEIDQLRMLMFETDALHRTDLSQKEAHTAQAQGKCQDELAIRDSRIAELETKLNGLTIQRSAPLAAQEEAPIPAALSQGLTAPAAHFAELEPLPALVSDLQANPVASNSELAFPELAHQIDAHSAALTAEDAHIAELEASIQSKDSEIAQHLAAHAAKDNHIARIPELEHQIDVHSTALTAKDAHIAELEPIAARIPELEAGLQAKDSEIAQHLEAHASKDNHIARIPELEHQIDVHSAALAAKDAHIAELEPMATRIPELETALAAKDARITELEAQIAAHLHTHRSDWKSFESRLDQYNSAKEHELADLHQRIEALSIDLQQAQESRAAASDELALLRAEPATTSTHDAEAPRTMAAAAGFSGDLNQSSPARPTSPENHHNDFEAGDSRKQIALDTNNTELKRLRFLITSLLEPLETADIAKRAFHLADLRNFKNGTEQEDWLKAENQLRSERRDFVRQSLHPDELS